MLGIRCKGTMIVAMIIVTMSLESQVSHGLEKYWMADTDWSNPNNWLDGLLPETDSRIIFPVEARHAIGMPKNADFKLAGIELPRDGIIALPENGKIMVSEKVENGHTRESRWLQESTFFWLDPLNWNASSEAAPHLEQLPCQGDVVVLPEKPKVFSMRLPVSRDIEVQAVRLADDNEALVEWEWESMSKRREFLGPRSSVKYNPLEDCVDCQCQDGDLSEYSEEICNIQRPRCGLPACEYPLEIEGHCCYYCGGRIRLSGKTLLSTTRRIVKNILKGNDDRLAWHLRLTWDGQTEILITEKGPYEGIDVIIATTAVQSALKEEEVQILYVETSGGPLYDYRLAVALGPFLGGFLALILIFLFLCFTFGYSCSQVWKACQEFAAAIFIDMKIRNGKKRSFAFARFENVKEGSMQLTEDEEPNLQLIRGEEFENPLFRMRKGSKTRKNLEKTENLEEPMTFANLQKTAEFDQTEEIEMDIENLS